jgi:hypothetical protein
MERYSMHKFAVTRIVLALAALGVAAASAQYTPADKAPASPAATVPATPETNPPAPEEKAKGKRAQRPAKAATPPAAPEPSVLLPLAWLEGCWRGSAGAREFREQWMPLRGNLMIGVSQTVGGDKTLDFEYLRFEPRADGIYYVISPPGKNEMEFRLAETSAAKDGDLEDTLFVFANPALEFPQKITYRHATQGWLYAQLDGKIKGADHHVVYPMRRIGCESGEIIGR